MTDAADILRRAMDLGGITDPETRAGIAAITMVEGGLNPRIEASYKKTKNARIRQVFGSRVASLSDEALNALKADDKKFFNWVYGPRFSVGRQLGNTVDPDDGYNFRGRSQFQLTGRAGYAEMQKRTGVPLLENPDMANDPEVGAAIAVAYTKWRYDGSGWAALKRAVGNNTPDIEARKDAAYKQFLRSGEFAAKAAPLEGPPPADVEDAYRVWKAASTALQTALAAHEFYRGAIDGDFYSRSQTALLAYLKAYPR